MEQEDIKMRKLFVMFIIVLITVIAGILYTAHSLLSHNENIVYLEQAYMAHSPAMPSIVIA